MSVEIPTELVHLVVDMYKRHYDKSGTDIEETVRKVDASRSNILEQLVEAQIIHEIVPGGGQYGLARLGVNIRDNRVDPD